MSRGLGDVYKRQSKWLPQAAQMSTCAKKSKSSKWKYCETIEEASFNTDGLVVLTAWAEFKNINWQNLYQFTRKPTWIFDTRNICDLKNAKKAGFKTWSLGSLNN